MKNIQKLFSILLIAISALCAVISLEVPAQAASVEQVLFVGNSHTFYNNSPEMFRRLVKAGTGKTIQETVVAYDKRTLDMHANAIEAVVRTKGSSKKLTNQEKTYFYAINKKEYSEAVYQGYVARIWNKKKKSPKSFQTVILQVYYNSGKGDNKATKVSNAILRIMKALNSKKTTYIIQASHTKYLTGLEQYRSDQDQIDQITEEAVAKVIASKIGKKNTVRISYYGRALGNYLSYYGTSCAETLEPELYAWYQSKGYSTINDILFTDGKHPTVPGSYLVAATLYTAYSGKNPQKLISKYRGGTTSGGFRVDGRKISGKAAGAHLYNNGNGIKSKKLLKNAALIAWKTQKETWKYIPVESDSETEKGSEQAGQETDLNLQ